MAAGLCATTKGDRRLNETFSIALDYHGPLTWILASLAFVGAHVLFILGQYLVLWEIRVLAEIENVSIDCPGIVTASLNDTSVAKQIQKYSYAEIIKALWTETSTAPFANIKFNVVGSSHMFALVIIFFSGVWPHAKLLVTHILWYTRTPSMRRTRALQWLEFFGKWSMVDVISVVIAITVFSLSFKGPTQMFVNHVVEGATTYLDTMVDPAGLAHVVCNGLDDWSDPKYNTSRVPSPSPGGCHDKVVPIVTDDATVQELLDIVNASCSPALGGGVWGNVNLALQADTLDGVYYFSTAVWLSLLLSACINMRNEVLLVRRHHLRAAGQSEGADPGLEDGHYKAWPSAKQLRDPGASFLSDNSEFREFLLRDDDDAHLVGDTELRKRSHNIKQCSTLFGHARLHWVWNVVTVVIAGAGVFLLYVVQFVPIMQRDILGSIRHTLDLVNNETDSMYAEYIMWDNALQIVDGQGSDPFLQKDLVIFTILGPGFCLLFSIIAAVVPLPQKVQWAVAKLAGLGFTFSGIEVLAFACAICTVILPVQSGDLVQTTEVFQHICQVMDHVYGLGREECFYEEYGVLSPAFVALPVLFILTAGLNWLTHFATERSFPTHERLQLRGHAA